MKIFFKRYSILIIMSLFLLNSCSQNGNDISTGNGEITGSVYSLKTGLPLDGVDVSVYANGTTYSTKSDVEGNYSIEAGGVTRGDGYNVQYVMASYDNATRAAVFELPNLRVDLGTVNLALIGIGSKARPVTRIINGIVYDGFSDNPLVGANVSTVDSRGNPVNAVTGSDGSFELSSKRFNVGSSYAITISKTGYTTDSSVVADVTGNVNTVNNNPIHLYAGSGDIAGTILDDNTGNPLEGVAVEAVDGAGSTITDTTDSSGNFQLSGSFYMDSTYNVYVSKSNYISGITTATIALSGDNLIADNPKKLLADITISGVVKKDSDGTPLENVTVSILDSDNNTITETTNSSGEYSFVQKPGIWKGVAYEINVSHSSYYASSANTAAIIPGNNIIADVSLILNTPPAGHTVSGTVKDYWSNGSLEANISLTDNGGNLTQTAGTDGSFSITGDFTCGSAYPLVVSLDGYSGETEIDKESMDVTINCDGGATSQTVGEVKLYPIGIRGNIAGIASTNYSVDLKQTYEKFLTNKIGFTLTARDISDLNTCSAFYLHIDESTSVPLPPEGIYSSTMTVNGGAASGAISHGFINENSVRPTNQKPSYFGVNSFTYYHFYVSDAGSFTIETSGATDTYMYLYDSTGGLIAQDDDSGADTNAKITSNLGNAGWYFVKVKGYDDSKYGEFTINVNGTVQNSGVTGTWTSNDLIISMYSNSDKKMYIAGDNESGSSGSLTISKYSSIGNIIRGTFNGTMREVSSSGTTKGVTNGYFNVIRSQ